MVTKVVKQEREEREGGRDRECVSGCVRERKRGREGEREREIILKST
jgi:hypothetical protein